MTTKNENLKDLISVRISGNALKAAIALRAQQEAKTGRPVSLTGIVNEAVLLRHKAEVLDKI
jgi:uncharacterized protein (DUF4415 family)